MGLSVPPKEHLCVLDTQTAQCMECIQEPELTPIPLKPHHKLWFTGDEVTITWDSALIIIIYTGGISGTHGDTPSSLPSLQSHPQASLLAPQITGEKCMHVHACLHV